MAVMDRVKGFVKSELIEIIEWLDESSDIMAYRFRDEDHEIKRGAQLIVRESQKAQLIYQGEFGDLFGPGLHRLETSNIPVLTTLQSWKYGFESPFKCEVYFVSSRLYSGRKWGTKHPILLSDPDFGMIRARAYGTYDVRIADVQKFLTTISGTNGKYTLPQFEETMRPRFVGIFTEALGVSEIPLLKVASRYREVANTVLPLVNEACIRDYGVAVSNLVIENVSVPDDVEKSIDQRASMGAIKNMDDFMKYQAALGLAQPGGSGMAKTAAELAIGLQLAKALTQEKTETK